MSLNKFLLRNQVKVDKNVRKYEKKMCIDLFIKPILKDFNSKDIYILYTVYIKLFFIFNSILNNC